MNLDQHKLCSDGMKPTSSGGPDTFYRHDLGCWVVELRELVTGSTAEEAQNEAELKLDAYRGIHQKVKAKKENT